MIIKDVNIGVNLSFLRNRAGYTQEELTTKMQLLGSSMSRNTYAKIETGKRNLKVSDLILLRQILNAEYSEILEGKFDRFY